MPETDESVKFHEALTDDETVQSGVHEKDIITLTEEDNNDMTSVLETVFYDTPENVKLLLKVQGNLLTANDGISNSSVCVCRSG